MLHPSKKTHIYPGRRTNKTNYDYCTSQGPSERGLGARSHSLRPRDGHADPRVASSSLRLPVEDRTRGARDPRDERGNIPAHPRGAQDARADGTAGRRPRVPHPGGMRRALDAADARVHRGRGRRRRQLRAGAAAGVLRQGDDAGRDRRLLRRGRGQERPAHRHLQLPGRLQRRRPRLGHHREAGQEARQHRRRQADVRLRRQDHAADGRAARRPLRHLRRAVGFPDRGAERRLCGLHRCLRECVPPDAGAHLHPL